MCSFQEKRWDGNLTKDVSAQYKVKYINEKKEISNFSPLNITLGLNPSASSPAFPIFLFPQLIEIPSLQTEQYQNEEGINPLRYPYCEYLILP